ncbi:MAG: hypothetical protein Fur0032_21900 [Terrimicrobiaceae bacterium]
MGAKDDSIGGGDGQEIRLLAVPDLVNAKKTQREKDWPVIAALVEGHFQAFQCHPTGERIAFWLGESRSAERLMDLAAQFPADAVRWKDARPLLALAIAGDLVGLREAFDAEVRAEKEKDRIYWEPLKREMEAFRRAERGGGHRASPTNINGRTCRKGADLRLLKRCQKSFNFWLWLGAWFGNIY